MKKKHLLFTITLGLASVLLITSILASAYSIDLEPQNQVKETENIIMPKDAEWYYKPDNYAELVGWYQDLEANYSEFIEVFKANEMYGTGQATGGYDLYYVRITNESLGFHKPEVLMLGGPHGDETAGTIGLYWFTDWLMRMAFTEESCPDYSKDWLRWLVDNREIYIEVSHNPYGFDHGPQRYDGNNWDLNREADHDGPGSPTGGLWASENGKTLRRFVDNHTIRIGSDIHAGVRSLIYPWASTNINIHGTSQITGYTNEGAPPDFYFYDASALRLGSYMGDCCGDGAFDETNVQTIAEYLSYEVFGGIANWAYAADVIQNPAEDQYVEDEIFGNYPGTGALWISPEMSWTKNVPESEMGNDTTPGWGTEIRRFMLHQTDICQPYVRWQGGTIEPSITITTRDPINLNWQVNGSLVVDHTYIQYGTNPNPIEIYDDTTSDYDDYTGAYIGGTGWEEAEDGTTNGITYLENLTILTPGEYYFVAKAQVDQVYANVLSPETYGENSYLRLVKERTNVSYYESLTGTDGVEEINGQTWWYSPIIHVTVINPPPHEIIVTNLDVPDTITHNQGVFVNVSITNDGLNNESNIDIHFNVNGSIVDSTTISLLNITETTQVSFPWNPDLGVYNVSIEAVPVIGETSTDNNIVSTIVEVISAPDIFVIPQTITLFNNEGVIVTSNITIGNEDYADEPLLFNCDTTDNSGYDWLSVNISSGLINPGDTINNTVTADTNGLPIGSHLEHIIITSDDPDEAEIMIPVHLHIVYAHDIRINSINQPLGTIPSGQHIVNATVENYGSTDQTNININCSIFEGGIGGVILDEDFSSDPVDWTITDTSGTAWEWDSVDERMENTYGYSPPNAGYLDSPVLDCSGKTGISLSFWHYWEADYSSGDQDGYVRGSIDGGGSFPFLIDEFHHNDPATEEGVKYYDISSWADGQSDVMVRFDVWNDNDWYWRIDDFNMSAEITGAMVYTSESLVSLDAYETGFVEFTPAWDATGGTYGIQVMSNLVGDQNTSNDIKAEVVTVEGPIISIDPSGYDFGIMNINETDFTIFQICNNGGGVLDYIISESCGWVNVSPESGSLGSGECDLITVEINTTNLNLGTTYECDIDLSSNGGNGIFHVTVFISEGELLLDINQSLFDRGFRVMPGWDGAQEFIPSYDVLSRVDLYMTTWGDPWGPIVFQICEDTPDGTVVYSDTISKDEVPDFPTFDWVTVEIPNILVTPDEKYVIVLRDGDDGDTHNCLMWGWCDSYGGIGPYPDGEFFFRKLGYPTWLPIHDWDFTFRTYGYT